MPQNAETLFSQAHARHMAGDLGEAHRLYREVLALQPDNADVFHMLGVLASQQGHTALGVKLIEAALGHAPAMATAWFNHGVLLRKLGRNTEALQSLQKAVAADPACSDAWDALGAAWREQNELGKARDCHQRAVSLQPDNPRYQINYATLLQVTGHLREAFAILKRLESVGATGMYHTMANTLKAAGYTDLAIPYFERSTAEHAEIAEVRVTEAMAKLQAGRFADAWKIWETRPSLGARYTQIPFWNGEKVRHLLVHEDQGIGDAFQCARFIPQLRAHAGKISIHVTPVLREVFAASFPDCDVQNLDSPVEQIDARVRMLSLPAFFNCNADHIPAAMPYLQTREEWRAPWRRELAARQTPRIGLVWAGNPDHLNDRLRSIATADIIPLLQKHGRNIVSLQKGKAKNGLDLSSFGVFDADTMLQDFSQTAGLVAELDLLISVDTATVHLAGALARPAWLLLPFDPDWRWLLGREDTPWYPTMRLYREQKPRDWPAVLARIDRDLSRFLAGDTSVLHPPRWNGGAIERNPDAIPLDLS